MKNDVVLAIGDNVSCPHQRAGSNRCQIADSETMNRGSKGGTTGFKVGRLKRNTGGKGWQLEEGVLMFVERVDEMFRRSKSDGRRKA